MTTDRTAAGGNADRPRPPQLGEVIDTMLGKGVVIESYNPISLLDIGLLGIRSRVSVTAVGRWDQLAAILGVKQPRKSRTRVRAHGRAQGRGMRPGKPRCRLAAEARPGIA